MINRARQYQSISVQTSIMDADPHRLIQLLYDGAMQHLTIARGCIERREIEERNRHINKAIEIIGGLRSFLDFDKGEPIASNLDKLYAYLEWRLFETNLKNSLEYLDECAGLLRQVKSAWDDIRPQVTPAAPHSAAAGAV